MKLFNNLLHFIVAGNYIFLRQRIMIDIAGTIKPMAAVNCIVNPQTSKAIVATLSKNVLQKPPLHPANKLKAATSPKMPKSRNITKSVMDVSYEIGFFRNCPIPLGVPTAAKQSLPRSALNHGLFHLFVSPSFSQLSQSLFPYMFRKRQTYYPLTAVCQAC